MQKIIQLVSVLCTVIVLIIACTVNEGIYGAWRVTDETPIFDSNINIVKLRTKEGANFPYYTLIYDENYHGAACQQNNDGQNLCLSLLLKTTNIHPSDEISSVVAAPIEDRYYELESRVEHHLGYNLLYWKMRFLKHGNQEITQIFRRNWF